MKETINDCLLVLSPDTGLSASDSKTIQDNLAKMGLALSSFETWDAATRDKIKALEESVYWTLEDASLLVSEDVFPQELRKAIDLEKSLHDELKFLLSLP